MTLNPRKVKSAHVNKEDHVLFCDAVEKASAISLEVPIFVEIGTHFCKGSLAIISMLKKLGRRSKFLTFDIAWPVMGRYPREHWNRKVKNQEGICETEFHEMEGRLGVDLVNSGEVAWVFVDGCHCEECVRSEVNAWAPSIAVGGYLLLHDCDPRYEESEPDQPYHGNEPRSFGVWKVSEENEILKRDFFLESETSAVWMTRRGRSKPYLFGGMRVFKKNA